MPEVHKATNNCNYMIYMNKSNIFFNKWNNGKINIL